MNKKAILLLGLSIFLGVSSYGSGNSMYGTFEKEGCTVELVPLTSKAEKGALSYTSEVRIHTVAGDSYSFKAQDSDITPSPEGETLRAGNEESDQSGKNLVMSFKDGRPSSLWVSEYYYSSWNRLHREDLLKCEGLEPVMDSYNLILINP